jgi:hypothetical protein
LNVAYKEALKSIESTAKDPQAKSEAAWAAFALDAQITPVKLSDDALGRMAGNYGTRHVTAEPGQLYLQLGDGPRRKLSPLTADTFSVDGADAPRLRFVVDGSGKSKLTEMFPDGRSNELSRE